MADEVKSPELDTKGGIDSQIANAQVANVQPQADNDKQETFTKEYVEELRKEAAKYRTDLKKREKAEEQARQEAAEKAGEYQKLYEETKSKYDALEQDLLTKAEKAAKYDEMLDKQRKDILKELPENLQKTFADEGIEKLTALKESLKDVNREPRDSPARGTGGDAPPKGTFVNKNASPMDRFAEMYNNIPFNNKL